jgi:hypothetical protein
MFLPEAIRANGDDPVAEPAKPWHGRAVDLEAVLAALRASSP